MPSRKFVTSHFGYKQLLQGSSNRGSFPTVMLVITGVIRVHDCVSKIIKAKGKTKAKVEFLHMTRECQKIYTT
jgi:hypothetical protein